MTTNQRLNQLKSDDTYALLLFALYKLEDIPSYATLSRLIYLFDKDVFLRLCDLFGGKTITFPTIDDVEIMLHALELYNEINIKHKDYEAVVENIGKKYLDTKKILELYNKLCEVLKDYKINGVKYDS